MNPNIVQIRQASGTGTEFIELRKVFKSSYKCSGQIVIFLNYFTVAILASHQTNKFLVYLSLNSIVRLEPIDEHVELVACDVIIDRVYCLMILIISWCLCMKIQRSKKTMYCHG